MHGPQNVRGGRYVDVKLSMTQQEELEQELKNSMESCYACGAAGHYMSECPELNGESVLTDSSMECL